MFYGQKLAYNLSPVTHHYSATAVDPAETCKPKLLKVFELLLNCSPFTVIRFSFGNQENHSYNLSCCKMKQTK